MLIGAISLDLIIRPDYKRSRQCFRYGLHDHRVKDYHKPGSGSSSGSGYGKWVIPAVNDDDSGIDSDSNEHSVDAVDWKNSVATGAWK
jgi:hypothetical protein